MGGSKIKSPEAYIWTRTLMSIVKGAFMVSIFVINGQANDFFLGLFFFMTTICGFVFFYICPFADAKEYKLMLASKLQLLEKPLYQIQF